MSERRITLQVRPFDRMIDTEITAEPLRCTGSIEDGAYIVRIGDGTYHVQTFSTGVDEWGPLAVLVPYEVSLGSGVELTVDAEPEDREQGSPLGCRIALTTRRDPSVTEQLLRSHEIDPETVNVLDSPDALIAIRFSTGGHFRGWAHLQRS